MEEITESLPLPLCVLLLLLDVGMGWLVGFRGGERGVVASRCFALLCIVDEGMMMPGSLRPFAGLPWAGMDWTGCLVAWLFAVQHCFCMCVVCVWFV